MVYKKYTIGDVECWTAQPRYWHELAYTINEEEPFLNHDPNNPKDYSHLLDLLK